MNCNMEYANSTDKPHLNSCVKIKTLFCILQLFLIINKKGFSLQLTRPDMT